jgi:hypothetical protein
LKKLHDLVTDNYKRDHQQTKSFRKFHRVGKQYMTLPLTITEEITDGPSPLWSSRELIKSYITLPQKITNWITGEMKFHWRILKGFEEFRILLKIFSFNYQQNCQKMLKFNKYLIVDQQLY